MVDLKFDRKRNVMTTEVNGHQTIVPEGIKGEWNEITPPPSKDV